MTDLSPGPGDATTSELRAYWRMRSDRAARELALKLGVRRVRGAYPWFAIWSGERLAPPPPSRWEELKRPHLTAQDLAEFLGESPRSARRRDHAKPDASFPDPVPLRTKPKLWRAAQVHVWRHGLPVPVYKTIPKKSSSSSIPEHEPSCVSDFKGFGPFAEARSAAKRNREMTPTAGSIKNDRHP